MKFCIIFVAFACGLVTAHSGIEDRRVLSIRDSQSNDVQTRLFVRHLDDLDVSLYRRAPGRGKGKGKGNQQGAHGKAPNPNRSGSQQSDASSQSRTNAPGKQRPSPYTRPASPSPGSSSGQPKAGGQAPSENPPGSPPRPGSSSSLPPKPNIGGLNLNAGQQGKKSQGKEIAGGQGRSKKAKPGSPLEPLPPPPPAPPPSIRIPPPLSGDKELWPGSPTLRFSSPTIRGSAARKDTFGDAVVKKDTPASSPSRRRGSEASTGTPQSKLSSGKSKSPSPPKDQGRTAGRVQTPPVSGPQSASPSPGQSQGSRAQTQSPSRMQRAPSQAGSSTQAGPSSQGRTDRSRTPSPIEPSYRKWLTDTGEMVMQARIPRNYRKEADLSAFGDAAAARTKAQIERTNASAARTKASIISATHRASSPTTQDAMLDVANASEKAVSATLANSAAQQAAASSLTYTDKHHLVAGHIKAGAKERKRYHALFAHTGAVLNEHQAAMASETYQRHQTIVNAGKLALDLQKKDPKTPKKTLEDSAAAYKQDQEAAQRSLQRFTRTRKFAVSQAREYYGRRDEYKYAKKFFSRPEYGGSDGDSSTDEEWPLKDTPRKKS